MEVRTDLEPANTPEDKPMAHPTRRTFLKQTAVAGLGATFTIAGTKASGKVLGANDAIRVGVAGIRGRGGGHISGFTALDGVQVTHLIDPDMRTWGSRVKQVEQKSGNRPKCFQDIRKALDDKNLDAVSIATCNHWHALITVWACQAGKDVYVEKPCSHNVFEGRKAVEAARKYKRMVQNGTQRRSQLGNAKLAAAITSGKYGKLLISYGRHYRTRGSIGFKEPKEPPKDLDFNVWLGPAPQQPYHENLVHYNWHWFWDTGNGELGNNGVHYLDVVRWVMGNVALPKTVYSLGGRYGYKDQAETPNTQVVVYDWGDVRHIFEIRGLKTPRKPSLEYHLEAGVIKNGKFYPKGKEKPEPLVDIEHSVFPGGPFGNFINCVRSRKQEELNADILQGHLSAALCHLGNISYRLGKEVPFGDQGKALGDDKETLEVFRDMVAHLDEKASLKLSEMTYRLGPKLKFDAKTEQFIGSPEANALLSRKYREPFVVPENV